MWRPIVDVARFVLTSLRRLRIQIPEGDELQKLADAANRKAKELRQRASEQDVVAAGNRRFLFQGYYVQNEVEALGPYDTEIEALSVAVRLRPDAPAYVVMMTFVPEQESPLP